MQDILIVTWHGIHELDIFPGLPDTGGQNIYVQNMAEKIHDRYECRVVILNRGGFVHPYSKRMREGMMKDPERELYVLHVSDGIRDFVRKEFLTGALIETGADNAMTQFPQDFDPELIISHFWDGGLMGCFLEERFGNVPHIWVPHEPIGMKKAQMDPSEHERHSIFLREHYEKRVAWEVDLIGSTSKLVENDLDHSYDADIREKMIDIYPGVDTERFIPLDKPNLPGKAIREDAEFLNLPETFLEKPHICEFGRSDSLKDKDKAVEVFAEVAKEVEDLVMFLNLDQELEPKVAEKIHETIKKGNLQKRVHIFSPEDLPQSGRGSHILPDVLKTSKVFLTMSVMEGFGMAACEAAASAVPVVGTDRIPVLTDEIAPADGGTVVPAKDVKAAAAAVVEILQLDADAYNEMSEKAYRSVVPKYTWDSIIESMFDQISDKKLAVKVRLRKS